MKKSKDKIKILFIYFSFSSFIKEDLEILKKHFNVKTIKWRGKRDILKIMFNVLRSDVTFSWFASDHAAVAGFFSKLFRKKSIVIVGGVDIAYIPELGYGQFTKKPYKKKLTRYAIQKADSVLAVSSFIEKEILKNLKPKNLEVVYNGINTEKFKQQKKKENIIVTIGSVTQQGVKIKGLNNFAKSSVHFPEYKSVIIGSGDDSCIKELKDINPNLVFTGEISHEEVSNWLKNAKIYCQFSYVESFGMGVAESMSCECVPVVTRRGALPELVGDTGFYVEYDDEKGAVEAIKKAVASESVLGSKARDRIKSLFSVERREQKLIDIIEQLVS